MPSWTQRRRGARASRAREATAVVGRGLGDARAGLAAVGERQHHARERDAVGDAVMDADEDRAAGAEVVDQIDLPQRAGVVERRRDAVRDEVLERRAVVRRGQRHVMEVQLRVEVRVVLPVRTGERESVRGALPEAVEARDDAVEEDAPCSGPSRPARRTRARC